MYKKYIKINVIPCLISLVGIIMTSCAQDKHFSVVENKAEKKIDITIDGKLFASYIYPDSLMKPVLYPIVTTAGSFITRGWPMDPRAGERIDHPHHVGLWFNYGNVNGLDFWNNSTSIPVEKRDQYGHIQHAKVNSIKTENDRAILNVSSFWLNSAGKQLLKEDTEYIFTGSNKTRAIQMNVKLTALKEDVAFDDNKEGLIGLRLARELEHPSDQPEKFTDANGIATEVAEMNNEGVTGLYRSSNGLEGDQVWGTRGEWVNLQGQIGEEKVSVVILDHENNIGFPTYWHARGYGLFAANPLGQKEFSEGKEILNFKLKAGESVDFKYKVLIQSGEVMTDDQVKAEFKKFQ